MFGFIVEKDIAATNVDALNENAVSTVDIEGGAVVTLGNYAKGGYTVALAGASAKNGAYMAYNPKDVHLMSVDGKLLPSVSIDPRDYKNWAGRTFTVFKPQVGDKIGFTAECFTTAPTASLKNITGAAGGKLAASATAPTAGDMAFTLLEIVNQPFPKADGIGMDNQTLYVCRCTSN